MLKFAVVGIGRMGFRHAKNLSAGRAVGVKLVAVCDTDLKAREKAKKLEGVRVYDNYATMFDTEKLDGVIIATPHYSHVEIAEYAIKKGVNTLIEKPVSVTTAAAKELKEFAKQYPSVKVGVSFNQRSNRMYRYAKKLLDSGELGEVQRVNFAVTHWYRAQAYFDQGGWRASYVGEGGGCLINQCVHQLDVLAWLVGMPESIVAVMHTKNRNITVENDVAAILKYENFDCVFSASTHELKGTNRLEIACDKGKIVIGKVGMKVFKHKSEKEVNEKTKFGYGFAPSTLRRKTYGFFAALFDIVFGQQLRSVRAFAAEIGGKGKQLATLDDGLNTIELINGIYLASWTGEDVNVPIDDEKYARALDEHKTAEADKTNEK